MARPMIGHGLGLILFGRGHPGVSPPLSPRSVITDPIKSHLGTGDLGQVSWLGDYSKGPPGKAQIDLALNRLKLENRHSVLLAIFNIVDHLLTRCKHHRVPKEVTR